MAEAGSSASGVREARRSWDRPAREAHEIGAGPGFTIRDVWCSAEHRHWSETELSHSYELVLVRSGAYRRRADGDYQTVDHTTGYLERPGTEHQFAHPFSGGDQCTAITFSDEAIAQTIGDPDVLAATEVIRVTARTALAHRRLLRAARRGEPAHVLSDHLTELLGSLPSGIEQISATRNESTAASHRRLAQAAKDALRDGSPATSLAAIAARLDISPWHLSRVFNHVTGMTISQYRNTVRIHRLIEILAADEHDLARLAVELSFADQAHMTRIAKAYAGSTPAQIRQLLVDGSS